MFALLFVDEGSNTALFFKRETGRVGRRSFIRTSEREGKEKKQFELFFLSGEGDCVMIALCAFFFFDISCFLL